MVESYYIKIKNRVNKKLEEINYNLGKVEEIVKEDLDSIIAKVTFEDKKFLSEKEIEKIRDEYLQHLIVLKKDSLMSAKKRLERFSAELDECYKI
jgi:hypothetical protein